MIRYIDEHKDRFGVEGICLVFGEQLECGFMTASGYWAAKRRPAAARMVSDCDLIPLIERLHAAHYGVYGVRKMWWLLNREGHQVGRDQVARLMRQADCAAWSAAESCLLPSPTQPTTGPTTWCNAGSLQRRRTGCGSQT